MRIHLIAVIKDEADIVGQTLVRAAELADHVYIRDIGSTDGTLEILHDVASRYSNIQVYSEPTEVYSDYLRQSVFLKFRENSKPGDLWGRFDCDEIMLDDPREVFRDAGRWDDIFWGSFFNFYMTDEDIKRYDEDPSLYDDDTPIDRRVCYYINNWAEPRFVRDNGALQWRVDREWPSLMNPCRDSLIRIAHYAFRSPKQIDARLASRWWNSAYGASVSSQDILPDFRARILDASKVIDNAQDMIAVAKRMAVERKGVPDVTWRDRIIPASDLSYDEPGKPMVERPELLPEIVPNSGFLGRGARRVVRNVLGVVKGTDN